MSREERRAYKRMMKNADPYALPASAAAKARDERQRARRQRIAASGATVGSGRPSGRFWWVSIGGGLLLGLFAFSFAWPQMPFALIVGVGVALAWAGLLFGLRALASRRPPPAG